MKAAYRVLAIIVSLILSGCGSSTTVMIKTKPSTADVVILNENGEQKGKVISDTIFKIKNNKDFFLGRRDTTNLILLTTKVGYKPKISYLTRIQKNEDNDDKNIITLEELDTNISIETNPPGANIWFYSGQSRKFLPFLSKEAVDIANSVNRDLIKDHLRDIDQTDKEIIVDKVVTPFEQDYTEDVASSELSKISKIYIVKQGYNPVVRDISIVPGESNVYSFHLKPFSTSLKIISDPEGVEVEDLGGTIIRAVKDSNNARRINGFGYLGKAPLIRKFNFDEVDKRYNLSGNSVVKSINLMLKITKSGYADEHVPVDITIGEQKTIKVLLNEQPKEVSFQSDPQGSHVYVYRIQKRKVFDEKSKTLKDKDLPHWKHLGVTPFTYYMDSSDPLKHTDKLKFSRPGFNDSFEQFKFGITNYHMVLEPKGSINYEGVIAK